MSARPGSERHARNGFTGVDVVMALVLATGLSALAWPLAASVLDTAEARHATVSLAAEIRKVRALAASTRDITGLVFERVGREWAYRVCRDRNANGLKRAEIVAGVDECVGPSTLLSQRFPQASIAVDGSLLGPEGDPPSTDPVRVGSTDVISCSASRGCTSGTVFVRSRGGVQFAARLAGATGRVRVLRYEPGSRRWREE